VASDKWVKAPMAPLKSAIGNRQSAIAMAAVLLLAALLRCIPLGLSNPRPFHTDEWDFVDSAVRMWAEGTLDPGRPYVHPGLYRYSIAAAYPLVSPLLPAWVDAKWVPCVAGRLVSAAMGVLAVWLVYRLARRVLPPGGALAAALLLAVAPLHVQFSHVAKPDVMSAAFVALATLLAWRLAEAGRESEAPVGAPLVGARQGAGTSPAPTGASPSRPRSGAPRRGLYVWAGVAVSLAVASKYSGIVAAAPVAVAHFIAPGVRRRGTHAPAQLGRGTHGSEAEGPGATPRLVWAWAAGRKLLSADLWLAAGCSIIAFAIASPYTLTNLRTILAEANRIIISRAPDPEALPQAPPLVQVARQAWEWVGPVPLLLAAAGVVLWWRERRRAALAVVGSAVVATVAMLSFLAVQQPFYLLPLVPAVAVLAAVPIAHVWSRRWDSGAVLLALCLAPSAVLSARELVRFWQPGTRQLARAWLEENLPESRGYILRDHDSLELAAEESLPVIDAGFSFYDRVDRDHLKRHGITHFVLSDTAAATGHLTPEAAKRRSESHARLLALGERLVYFPRFWWRDGPRIEIYKVKESVLAEFAREHEQVAKELGAKVKAVEDRLAAAPGDAALHMEAGRLLCDQADVSRWDRAVALWQRAEGHFRQASKAAPRLADAHYNLGCLYLRVAKRVVLAEGADRAAGVFARAAQAFRDAIALDPNQADYHFNLGYALCSLASAATRNEEARRLALEEGVRAYHRAAELNPDIRLPDADKPGPPHIEAVAERGPQPFR